MIFYISASAILTVVATGLQFVGLFLPTWWQRQFSENKSEKGYYYFGLWKYPWKAELCKEDICQETQLPKLITPTWLVFTRLFEVAGAGFGILLIAIMLLWLILLGYKRSKHYAMARKLGLVSSFLQIITAIFINIGILILVVKTSPSSILTGTILCGLSLILFCIGGALSYYCVKRMRITPHQNERRRRTRNNRDPNVSVINAPPYCDPPPSYEEIMGAHFNEAMVVDANMSPELDKHPPPYSESQPPSLTSSTTTFPIPSPDPSTIPPPSTTTFPIPSPDHSTIPPPSTTTFPIPSPDPSTIPPPTQ